MRKPDFIIAGAPKCGTTSMNKFLGEHPGIFIPEIKECHFFGSDLIKIPGSRRYDSDSYLSLFSSATAEQKIGETSVMYLCSELAAKEIKDFIPSCRIIIMLRNPVEVLHSYHAQMVFIGLEDEKDFGVALEKERARALRLKEEPMNWVLLYRKMVRFSGQVQRYFDCFGRERVHIVIFDDYKNDRPATYRDVLSFLDVSTDFEPAFEIINPHKEVRSRAFQDFLLQPPVVLRSMVRKVMSPEGRHRLANFLLYKLNSRFVNRPPLEPELQARLCSELAPEVETLSALLGRDLTYWTKC